MGLYRRCVVRVIITSSLYSEIAVHRLTSGLSRFAKEGSPAAPKIVPRRLLTLFISEYGMHFGALVPPATSHSPPTTNQTHLFWLIHPHLLPYPPKLIPWMTHSHPVSTNHFRDIFRGAS